MERKNHTRVGLIDGYGYTDCGSTDEAYIPHKYRKLGVHCVGARGSGKSLLMGRYIVPKALQQKTAQIVFDNGDTIDNLLYQISTWSPQWQEAAFSRLRYVDMAGVHGYVTPFPFYYKFGAESAMTIAGRFPEIIRKTDPALQSASIQGFNPLKAKAIQVGLNLLQKGHQITEMAPLVDRPETLKMKLLPFQFDEVMRSVYGASEPGIDWARVVDRGETVLLDFRHFLPSQVDEKRLALLWSFTFLQEFIHHRGIGASPLSIVIDELYDFAGGAHASQEQFAFDLQNFMQVNMRRYDVWLTLAHQEMNQFLTSPTLQKLLTGLGVQIIGQVPDRDDAVLLARRLFTADPLKIKRSETRWDSFTANVTHARTQRFHLPIDEHEIDFALHEQYHLHAQKLMNIKPLSFALWKPDMPYQNVMNEEHDLQRMIPFTIAWEEEGRYLDPEKIAAKRMELLKLNARPIADVLAEIAARTQGPGKPGPSMPLPEAAPLPLRRRGRDTVE